MYPACVLRLVVPVPANPLRGLERWPLNRRRRGVPQRFMCAGSVCVWSLPGLAMLAYRQTPVGCEARTRSSTCVVGCVAAFYFSSGSGF